MLQWNRLLSDVRAPKPGRSPRRSTPDPFRSPFEADYDRVVYSHAFRRLGRKTQVHPLAPNDHVHNRLTHSIEVASVGRSFGRRLEKFLIDSGQFPADREVGDVACSLQAACLVHDIGNPPFGHAGEYAIRAWVKGNPELVFGSDVDLVSEGTRADWEIFEGNAQGFRLAARSDNQAAGYMQLTFATLGAMIKYPWGSTDLRAVQQQKFNVFSSEQDLFELLIDELGLRLPDGNVARHPLSFLSEAADDICYRILDLEDAVEMRILEEPHVRSVLATFLDPATSDKVANAPLPVIRAAVIGQLVEACWQIFENDYGAIMAGERTCDLKSDFPAALSAGIAEVKSCYGQIFAHAAKVSAEIGAYETLGRIVAAIVEPCHQLSEQKSYRKLDYLSRRRFQLAFGEAYTVEHQNQSLDWWLHQVLDFVSGLTDNSARQLSRDLAGVG